MADAPSKRNWMDLADFDLAEPEDALSLIERFQMEWGNGGLSQMFSNWNRADIVMIPEALRMVGVPEIMPILEAAIAEFPDGLDDWRGLGSDAMLNPANPVEEKLRALDRALGDHETMLARAVTAFELKLSEDDEI